MADEPVCVDCDEAKRSAEARSSNGTGQLQLGECQPLYEAWTECIKRSSNQATSLPSGTRLQARSCRAL